MPLPTLLSKGVVKKSKHMDPQDRKTLDDTRAVDYIMNYIEKRLSTKKKVSKIVPKKLGHKVILLRSGTGSGKSTTIAPELYKNFQSKVNRNIVITQPRILTAIDKAQDMANIFPEMILGVNVGYQTGARSFKPREKGITSMTPGILLNILATTEPKVIARRYSFIIIDEIHDKDINTDTNLFLIKKFLKEYWKEPDCPFFILMSATFEPSLYTDYFDCPPSNFIEVEGRTFPIVPHYAPYDVHNYITYALHTALRLHVENIADLNSGSVSDIMIFVKNKKDAKDIIEGLHMFNATVMTKGLNNAKKYVEDLTKPKTGGTEGRYFLLPILLNKQSFSEGGSDYRSLYSEIKYLQVPIYEVIKSERGTSIGRNVVEKVPASRKVIVSTPVAETGITIPSLKYCIDTGWVLSPEFNPDFGTEILLNKNVTRNMAMQRQGRVGRLDTGEWYPCYTKETFDALPEDLHSKFVTDDITVVLLNIIVNETKTKLETVNLADYSEKNRKKLFRHFKLQPSWHELVSEHNVDFKKLDFFAPPSASGLCYSLEKLYVLGLIDLNYNPTVLGFHINQLRKVNIEPIRMVFAGFAYGANILDLITIAAFLQVERRNICGRKYKLRNPASLESEAAQFYNRVFVADEFIDSLFIWNEFMTEVGKIETMVSDGSKKKFSINYIKEWCNSNDIKYDGLLYVISTRDELIESLISIGVDVYYNGMDLKPGTYNLNKIFKQNLEEGIDEIKKIKRCILDGYRFNLAQWNKNINSYEMICRPVKVKVTSELVNEIATEQSRPHVIAISGLLVQSDFQTISYDFQSSGAISVLDGFVDLDALFTKK
jgi:HrpA-like RNA helicase